MRTHLNTLAFVAALMVPVTFSNCGNNAPADATAEHGDHIYSCPMHPEVTGKEGDKCRKCGMALEHTDKAPAEAMYACPMHPDVTGKMGDKCSKCGMALEPMKMGEHAGMDHAAMAPMYNMAFVTEPLEATAGKPVMLSFTPKKDDDANAQVALDVVHTKKLHLIVASSDLSYYDHIHPEYQADGSYTVRTTLPAGGKYVLFADYTPTGASNTVNRLEMKVAGTPAKTVSYSSQRLTADVDGYKVALTAEGGTFYAKGVNHMGAPIKKADKLVNAATLENIMGTKGHLVIISADGQRYIHVHPEMENGQLDLHANFGEPGLYRAFFQFQTGGKVHTADFVIDAKDGEVSADEGEADHDHSAGAEKKEHHH